MVHGECRKGRRIVAPAGHDNIRVFLRKDLEVWLAANLRDNIAGLVNLFLDELFDRAAWPDLTAGKFRLDQGAIDTGSDRCNLYRSGFVDAI